MSNAIIMADMAKIAMFIGALIICFESLGKQYNGESEED